MDVQTILIIILVGVAAGMLGGLVGVCGGIIIVPALVYFIGFSQKTAQGTTIFMFLLPIGLLSVYNYYKAGHVDFKFAAIMAITFFVGSYFGSKTAIAIDTKVVKQIFAVVMILVGVKMLWNK